MLEVGHLINYNAAGEGQGAQRLIVTLVDAVRRRAGCYTANRQFLSFEIDYDEKDPASCQIVAKVIEDWPIVQAKGNKSYGSVLAITLNGNHLARHEDWAILDVLGSCPTIYFNPSLGLQIGQVLALYHEGGSSSRIEIPPAFLTFSQILERNRRAAPVKPEEKTAYDMILSDDFDDE